MDGGLVSVEKLEAVLALIKTTNLKTYDDYYRGNQPLAFISPDVRAQVGDRIPEIVLNVPRVVVGAIEERLDVQGFAVGGDREANETLRKVWSENDLDEWSQLEHIEALKHGIAFATVWSDDDLPSGVRVAVESAHQMAVEFAPGTRHVAAAAKRWQDVDEDGKPIERAVLYLPDVIEHYWRTTARPFGQVVTTVTMPGTGQGWVFDEARSVPNPLGEVPVVPFINRPSLTDMSGESELRDVMTLTDGVNKLLSDMMVTSEHHAEPRRYATGMQIPKEAANNERLRDEVRAKWDEATRGKTWLAGEGVQFGQFAQAELNNFKTGVDLILSKVAFITGLAPHMLGITTENPASAEAIRSSETPLIRRVERKKTHFGGSWVRVMRLVFKVRGDETDADGLRTIWANSETRTFAQDADAVVKLTGGDRPVITLEAGREILGFTPEQVRQMQEDAASATSSAATADVEARMEQARRLVEQDGLSQNAALAAVGLIAAASANARTTGATEPGQ